MQWPKNEARNYTRDRDHHANACDRESGPESKLIPHTTNDPEEAEYSEGKQNDSTAAISVQCGREPLCEMRFDGTFNLVKG